jgi:hypothetical protein
LELEVKREKLREKSSLQGRATPEEKHFRR